MLKGFNPWQKRLAVLGLLGGLLSLLGLIGRIEELVPLGFILTVGATLILVLLGNRQNWRQLNAVQRIVENKKTHSSAILESPTKISDGSIPFVGTDYEYARRIKTNRSSLESFALRNKSLKIRDAFALAATSNQYRFSDLCTFIAAQRMKMLPNVNKRTMRNWDSSVLMALARLQANQRATRDDLQNAANFFSFIHNFFGLKTLRKNDRLIYLEALGELGQYTKQAMLAKTFNLEKISPVQATLIELNRIQHDDGPLSEAWINNLNTLYEKNGQATITHTQKNDSAPLDCLTTVVTQFQDGPLVSVLLPTYQGGPELITAVMSLLNQSWKNLEIIIIDDGSGPAYEQYLLEAQNLSERIKIIRQPENRGAYEARNRGLEAASGEFITVHDDDDWSHGDKIKLQAQQLLENPEVPGNMTSHVRSTEDLKFVRINNNPSLSQANFSSLMVRKDAFDKIGHWDTVNRGGDSELRDRLVKYYGQPVAVIDHVPLSFTRTWEGSLTSGEMSRGYVDPSRLLYLNAYTQAHAAVEDLNNLKTGATRQYPVPTTMEPGQRNSHLGSFDVVFMTDYRFPGGTTSLTLREINVASRAGLRVGYIHAESPLNAPTHPINAELLSMQMNGLVTQIGLQDQAIIDLLVVRHPSVTTYMDQATTNLTVSNTILIVNNPPILTGGEGMVFDLNASEENLDRLFNGNFKIVAESTVTRNISAGLISSDRLCATTWPGVVPLSQRTEPDFARTPVVGRHSRDHALKWPTTVEEFTSAYKSSFFKTKILGGAEELEHKHGPSVTTGISVFEYGEIAVADFLQSVDFWVYFHDDSLNESFGMSIAEAMAAGKIVILPFYLQQTFGDGALYSQPDGVEEIVRKMWQNPTDYNEQASKARKFVESHFSEKSLLDRIHYHKNN